MLAIAGGKGGCGKTTTTVALAAALARQGAAPLAVDTDVAMPDLHLVADVSTDAGLSALAAGESPAAVAHTATAHANSEIVPTDGAAVETAELALDTLHGRDGPILVDCPAGAARDAAVGLRHADRSLLVTTPQPETLRDTAKTAAMARTLDAPPVGVVAVGLPHTGPASTPDLPEPAVRRLFECPLLGTVPSTAQPPLQVEIVRTAYRAVARKLSERNI
jgi:septum site-determining protein MinD